MNEGITIIDEWIAIKAPEPPVLSSVNIDVQGVALLVMDIQRQNCNLERRPRCVASIPRIKSLLNEARKKGMVVIHSLIPNSTVTDILGEVSPLPGEPVVQSGVDKFFKTNLEELLGEKNVHTVILVGTAAHGAVLHTATGAALRGLRVIVPVDGMSADTYAEQYTTWHLATSPGTRSLTTLTKMGMIQIRG